MIYTVDTYKEEGWFGDNDHGHSAIEKYLPTRSFASLADLLAGFRAGGFQDVLFVRARSFQRDFDRTDEIALLLCEFNFTIWTTFYMGIRSSWDYWGTMGFAFMDPMAAVQFRLLIGDEMEFIDPETFIGYEKTEASRKNVYGR